VIDALTILVNERWREYARPRYATGERNVRESAARESFDTHTANLFTELRRRASRAGFSVDYELGNLQLAVLNALECSCQFCGRMFGMDTWAASYAMATSERGLPNFYVFRSLLISCAQCSVARAALEPHVWIDVLAALKRCDVEAAESFLDALVTGRLIASAAGEGSKVLPGPAGMQVTRERLFG
jgi:hypothetical protein